MEQQKTRTWVWILGIFLLLGSAFTLWNFVSFTTPFRSHFQTKTTDLSSISRIVRANQIIERYYYDPNRIQAQQMLEEGLQTLSLRIPELLISLPQPGEMEVSIQNQNQSLEYTPPVKLSDTNQIYAQVFQFLQQNYKGDVKPEDREYAVIAGMLKILDPHSNALPPEAFQEFKTQTSGEYGGLGIVIGLKDEELTVIAPIENTPAERAGIQTDDKILQIDSSSTINMPLSDAVDRLRGKVGSKVSLLVERKKRETFEVNLTREQITIQSVKAKTITEKGKRLAILSIRGFQEDTFQDMVKALTQMEFPLDGIILDLRNNPGGLLDQSLDMADLFIGKGPLLYTVGADNTQEEVNNATENRADLLDIPMIVLVNHGSASASEIVAGALKNNNRAVILGQPTFGKGSVQSLYPLPDGGSIKLTIAQYLTPGRISIQAVGITPDIQTLPAVVGEKEYDLIEDESYGEKELDAHLENKALLDESKPEFKLSYVEEAKDEKNRSEYTIQINEKKDYLLRLAASLLTHAPSANREEMLATFIPLLEQEVVKQDDGLIDALKKHEINWGLSSKPIPTKVQLGFDSSFQDINQSKITSLPAGKTINWNITLENKDHEILSRLLGVVRAKNPLLNDREFVFGTLNPGEKKTSKVEIEIPKDMLNLKEEVKIEIRSDRSKEVATFKVPTQFSETPKPILSYRYQLESHSTENPNFTLNLTLRNTSANAAENVIANLKNLDTEGIFLNEGRTVVGEVAAKSERKTHLTYSLLRHDLPSTIDLELSIIDKNTRSGVINTLTLPTQTDRLSEANPPLNLWLEAPKIQIQEQTLNEEKAILHLEGKATDDEAIADILIFAGDKKVFYRSGTNTSFEFRADIPLKSGMNVIQVQARDQRKLTAIQNLSYVIP